MRRQQRLCRKGPVNKKKRQERVHDEQGNQRQQRLFIELLHIGRVLNCLGATRVDGYGPGIITGDIWTVPGIFAADQPESGRLPVFRCRANLFLSELLRKLKPSVAMQAKIVISGLGANLNSSSVPAFFPAHGSILALHAT